MRLTNNILMSNLLTNLTKSEERSNKLQTQIQTTKLFSKPSEDPAAAAKAYRYRTQLSKIEQYIKNTEDGMEQLTAQEEALSSYNELLQRARELNVQATGVTLNDENRNAIATELEQIKGQMVSLMNTSYNGKYVFSGFQTDQKLVNDKTGHYATDIDASEQIKYEVGTGNPVTINTIGTDVFGEGKTGDKPEAIQIMDNLITALKNDGANIQNHIADIDKIQENVLSATTDIGARYNRLETTKTQLEGEEANIESYKSINEDTDIVEAYVKLVSEQSVYQAALNVGSKIIQPTLLDFLR